MKSYTRRLKVCDPDGKVVKATIEQRDDKYNRLVVRLPDSIRKKATAPFIKKGKITFTYERENHKEAIKKVEKYLESLFLGELEDEDNNTSKSSKSNARRGKKSANSKSTTSFKGQGSNALSDRGRGSKQTESDRGRVENLELDSESDPSVEGEAKPEN